MTGPAGPPLYLLTCHGTLLLLDPDSATIRHVPIDQFDGQGGFVTVDAASATLARFTLRGQPHPQGQGIAFRSPQGFLSAELNGSTRLGAAIPLAWECFLPISAADIACLRDIMRTTWRLRGTGRMVPPRQIGFSTEFRFHVGDVCLDLRERLPVERFASRDQLILPTGTGDPAIAIPADRAHAPPSLPPRIWIDPLGSAGNRALQYFAAAGLRRLVPGAIIENIDLPEWGMRAQAAMPEAHEVARMGRDRYWIDMPGLADCLRRRVVDAVAIDGFCFNIAHYPPRAEARTLLGAAAGGDTARGFGCNELVCSVRGGEILAAAHEDYILLPPAYYALLADISGLDLVFFGQIGDDPYAHSLREAFPNARFVRGRNAAHDFDTLRRSQNIAPSVSTFAWLAAWLSEADRIYLPVAGLFNPAQHPGQTYLPLDDPHYTFCLLPYSKSVNVRAEPEKFRQQQALLSHGLRRIDTDAARAICARASLRAPRQPHVGGFDPAYYIARYPDAARAAYGGRQSALEHYMHIGFGEGRRPCDFDRNAYCAAYPDAAMAIAEGHFADPFHHYTEIGWQLGYRPRPALASA